MARPATLSRDRIVDAAASIARTDGPAAVTARRLGAALKCDPSAVYRHFMAMDEIHREVGDRVLAAVDTASRAGEAPLDLVRRLCIDLRSVLLASPRLAPLVQAAPTRLENEVRITEALLGALLSSGMDRERAAVAYHALIELTIGSAIIDAAIDGSAVSGAEYERWRDDYRSLAAVGLPSIAAVADVLYRGTAAGRFEKALDAMLAGLDVLLAGAPQPG